MDAWPDCGDIAASLGGERDACDRQALEAAAAAGLDWWFAINYSAAQR
ncbi:MAG TPA: hypothetical protein VF134_02645 [Candidatus Dormibacteraeota bacterium]